MSILGEFHPLISSCGAHLTWILIQVKASTIDARFKTKRSYITFHYDDILKSEDWKSQGLEPKHLLYITSMPDVSHFKIPSRYNTSFPEQMTKEMKNLHIQRLPEVLKSISPNSFPGWSLQLVCPY